MLIHIQGMPQTSISFHITRDAVARLRWDGQDLEVVTVKGDVYHLLGDADSWKLVQNIGPLGPPDPPVDVETELRKCQTPTGRSEKKNRELFVDAMSEGNIPAALIFLHDRISTLHDGAARQEVFRPIGDGS